MRVDAKITLNNLEAAVVTTRLRRHCCFPLPSVVFPPLRRSPVGQVNRVVYMFVVRTITQLPQLPQRMIADIDRPA